MLLYKDIRQLLINYEILLGRIQSLQNNVQKRDCSVQASTKSKYHTIKSIPSEHCIQNAESISLYQPSAKQNLSNEILFDNTFLHIQNLSPKKGDENKINNGFEMGNDSERIFADYIKTTKNTGTKRMSTNKISNVIRNHSNLKKSEKSLKDVFMSQADLHQSQESSDFVSNAITDRKMLSSDQLSDERNDIKFSGTSEITSIRIVESNVLKESKKKARDQFHKEIEDGNSPAARENKKKIEKIQLIERRKKMKDISEYYRKAAISKRGLSKM